MWRSRTILAVVVTLSVVASSGLAIAEHGSYDDSDCDDSHCIVQNAEVTGVIDHDGDGYASGLVVELDLAWRTNFDKVNEDEAYINIHAVGEGTNGMEQHGLIYRERIPESVRKNLGSGETKHYEFVLPMDEWNGDLFTMPARFDTIRVDFTEESPNAIGMRASLIEPHYVSFDQGQYFEQPENDRSRTVRFEVNDASGVPISESANPTVSIKHQSGWESLPMDGSESVYEIPADWRTRWGERAVRFAADGYEAQRHDLSAKLENGVVEARLDRAQKPVVVDANVADAQVYSENGAYLGPTPYSTQREVDSPLTVSVEKPGYINDTVTVDPGDSASAYLISKTTESINTSDDDGDLIDPDLNTWDFTLDPGLLDAVTSIVSADVDVSPFTTVSSGETVTFDTESSYSLSGNITDITVETGDGRTYTTGPYSPRVSHVYTEPGTYTARVVVADDNGNQANTTQQIVVENVPPTPRFSTDSGPDSGAGPIEVGTSTLFDASNSTDYEGTLQYDWTFGDGASSTGRLASHTYENPGLYAVTLRVTDAAGVTVSQSKRIQVVEANDPPTPEIDVDTDGQTVTVDASASTDDGSIDTVVWNMGDGTSHSGESQTHTYDEPGEYTVELRVVDDDGAVERTTTTVTIQAPPSTTPTDEQTAAPSEDDASDTTTAAVVTDAADATTSTAGTGSGTGPGFGVVSWLVASGVLAILAASRRLR